MYFLTEECGAGCHPLVSGKYGVPDTALTASSMWSADYGPPRGRLNSPTSWSAIKRVNNEWAQVMYEEIAYFVLTR